MTNDEYRKVAEDPEFLKYIIGNDAYSQLYFGELVKNKAMAYTKFASFSPSELETYRQLLYEFKEQHKNDGLPKTKSKKKDSPTTLDVGNTLEDLVDFIFKSLPAFEIAKKVRTNSNEIDHIIKLSPEGKSLGLPFIRQQYIIGESKNYDDKIGVTWANKVYSLMSSTSTRLAIVFSYYGFTGTGYCGGWQEAKGFTKKILLSSMGLSGHNDEKAMYILDFNIKHFEMLAEGNSILTIIENEILTMKTDAKSDLDFLQTHEKIEDIVIAVSLVKQKINDEDQPG